MEERLTSGSPSSNSCLPERSPTPIKLHKSQAKTKYHAAIMVGITRQKEEERLQELYRSKSDEELIQIVSSDPSGFTGVASSILDAELTSRNLPSLAVWTK